MNTIFKNKTGIWVIASENSWIEGKAERQLQKTSELDGVEYCVGLPDIHPGRGNPVGAAYLIRDIIYPYLIGNDVGCGISLFRTGIRKNKIKIDKWIRKLGDLNEPYGAGIEHWMDQRELKKHSINTAIGTIGAGNHFAELQTIKKVFNEELFSNVGLDKNLLTLVVHSGSRGIGETLLRSHTDIYGAGGLRADSQKGKNYLAQHDQALKWATCNRIAIAEKFVSRIGTDCQLIIDTCHNKISYVIYDNESFWLHRKGAVVSDSGPVLIPGSRGSLSYLVRPKGAQRYNLWSLPHGAGRKWNRTSCKGRLKARYNISSLKRTGFGGHVICDDRELLYEEAPQAYKNIDQVIQDLLDENLVEVIATFKPLITYKKGKNK
ncbi:MAG: RNA ligase RtcB family protein [Desulfobacterales bacterium]|nr:RNA ligase RtcB family protein [Desulfobacterales bacterium]